MEQFKTRNVLVDFEGCITGHVTIDWTYDTEMREWGVKDFSVCVPDQTVNVVWATIDKDDEDNAILPDTLFLKNVKVTNTSFGKPLCPTEVSCWRGTWEVSFG